MSPLSGFGNFNLLCFYNNSNPSGFIPAPQKINYTPFALLNDELLGKL